MAEREIDSAPVVDVNTRSESHRTSNFIFKILALLAAICIWFYAQSVNNPSSEKTVTDIPVQVVNLTTDSMSVMSGSSMTVDLTVSGKKKVLDKLTPDDFTVIADASEAGEPGEYILRPVVSAKPEGVTVKNCSAELLPVYLDSKSQKTVPVAAYCINYTMDAKYEMGVLQPEISNVTVTGPSTLLETIVEARVLISLDGVGVSGSLNAKGAVTLFNRNDEAVSGNGLTCSETNIGVHIPVYIYRDIPLQVKTLYGYYTESNAKITVSPETVRVRGEESVLDGIAYLPLEVLDETKISTDCVTEKNILCPDGVTLVDSDGTADISVQHIGTALASVSVSNISVVNPAARAFTVLTQPTVEIRVPASETARVTPENVFVEVDLSPYAQNSGRTQIHASVKMTGMDGIMAYVVGDYWVTVDLQ